MGVLCPKKKVGIMASIQDMADDFSKFMKDFSDSVAQSDAVQGNKYAKKISRSIRDFSDAIGISDFAQDQRLAKNIGGIRISRDDYELYSPHGLLQQIFYGMDRPQDTHYGLAYGFSFDDADHFVKYSRTTDVLHYLHEHGVIIDLDDPKQSELIDVLEQGIESYSMKFGHVPPLMEPYCDHEKIKPTLDRIKTQNDHPDPIPRNVNIHSLTQQQLDDLADQGIGF